MAASMAIAQEAQQRAEVPTLKDINSRSVHENWFCSTQVVSSSSSSCTEEAITDIPDIIVDPVEEREVG